LVSLLILVFFFIFVAAIFKIFKQDSLENIHENHLPNDNQGEEVDNSDCSKALNEDKHVRVPILPCKHSKD
jgi:hypothetical protein